MRRKPRRLRCSCEQDYYAAHRLIKEGDSNLALSYLARSVQYDPKNELARMAMGQVLLFNQNFPFKLAAVPLRHEKGVWSAAFSPDGRFVATASSDKTAHVWEAATGKPIGEPLRHEEAVNSAAFSPDGRFVATASSDKTARVWEAATGKPIGQPLRHEKAVSAADVFRAAGTCRRETDRRCLPSLVAPACLPAFALPHDPMRRPGH
jgi:WD40 repeat protein